MAHLSRLPSSDYRSAELLETAAASALFEPKALEKAFELGEEEENSGELAGKMLEQWKKNASKAKKKIKGGGGVGKRLC